MIKKIILRILLALGLVIVVLAGNLAIFSVVATKVSDRTPFSNPPPPNKALLVIDIQGGTTGEVSAGAELDPRLQIHPGEVVVKRRSDPFIGTQLDQILTEHQIGELVLVGLDAGHCVKSAAMAARNRAYDTMVVEEAVITNDVEDKAEVIEELRALGVHIVSAD